MSKFLQPLGYLLFSLLGSSISYVVYGETPIYQLSDVQGAFLQVPLTHDIYRYSQDINLQDLVVLDAEENPLPYRLVTVEQTQQAPESHSTFDPLMFYPVSPDASADTLRRLHTTQVKVKGDKVEVATTDKTLNNQTPEFYLIDISELDHDITSLNIDWVAQANNQYLEVELEATRNLQDWFSLTKSTLVQIHQPEQSLKRNNIDVNIAKKQYEYIRLRLVRGAENLQITNVTAEQKIGSSAKAEKPSDLWSISGQIAKTHTTVYLPNSHSKIYPVAAWEFIRDEATPIESIAIDFGKSLYGDGAKIFSRSAENLNWQLRYQGIWFNAQIGSEWQKSDAVKIYRNTDKYWRIELNESAQGKIDPHLVLAWQPTQMQIIANNRPPFVVAVASDKNNNREQVFDQIVSGSSPVWVAAKLVSLNLAPEVISTQYKTKDWKQWLFWAALLLAVAVLLIFSLKLFKQLNLAKVN